MYCPKCGTIIHADDMLFGGCCSYRCSCCDFYINCYDVFTDELEEDTKPIYSLLKAMRLKYCYEKRKNKDRAV